MTAQATTLHPTDTRREALARIERARAAEIRDYVAGLSAADLESTATYGHPADLRDAARREQARRKPRQCMSCHRPATIGRHCERCARDIRDFNALVAQGYGRDDVAAFIVQRRAVAQ